jgi:putative ABC transport system permease protein
MSYGVSRLFNAARLGIGWLIPWGSVAICVITVAILIAVIMRYSVRKIKKQNIIETIRQESF